MDDLVIPIIILVVIIIVTYAAFKGLRVVLLKILKIEQILLNVKSVQSDLSQTIVGLNKIEQSNKERHKDTIFQLKEINETQHKLAKSLEGLK